MSVKKTVFGSKAERAYYYELKRQWGGEYQVFHNLPFLFVFAPNNLIDPRSCWSASGPASIHLTPIELSRLKKTSIDFTLCDHHDTPILCIEFDGWQEGTNVGSAYLPQTGNDQWRTDIMELKLKVAHGSLFPYFVVNSDHFASLAPQTKLNIVDGIIGEVLAGRETRRRFDAGFNPEDVGFTQPDFDELPPGQQDELIQDWVLSVEVDCELQFNPISRRVAELRLKAATGWESRYRCFPESDETAGTVDRVKKEMENALMNGATVRLSRKGFEDIESTVMLPNFQVPGFSSGFGLAEEIATLICLERALERNESTDGKVIPQTQGRDL
jgi:hypothetical protein